MKNSKLLRIKLLTVLQIITTIVSAQNHWQFDGNHLTIMEDSTFVGERNQPMVSNQNIWLVNSHNKIASALDTVIDRSFFDAKKVAIWCLNEIPSDVEVECSAYGADSTKRDLYPIMTSKFTGPELHPRLLERLLLMQTQTELFFLIRVKGDKREGQYQFVGSLLFRIAGDPKQAVKPKEQAKERIWLVNHKGHKMGAKDTAISKQFFKQAVMLKTNTSFGENPNMIVLLQQEDTEWRAVHSGVPLLSDDVLLAIRKQPIGNKVFIVFQNKTAQGDLIEQVQFDFVLKE